MKIKPILFSLGDVVKWTSQSQGYVKNKEGVVVAVVPPLVNAVDCIPPGFREPGSKFGMRRNHESYLVRVGKRKILYWPRVYKILDHKSIVLSAIEVDDNGCWIWKRGKLNKHGYGMIHDGKHKINAHRFSWKAFKGDIPVSMCVLHKCDNPPCVNPDHMFLGSHADNMRDMANKGRAFCKNGSKHPFAKLNENIVASIRAEYKRGVVSQRVLASKYGVSQSVIMRVLQGKIWAHDSL